VIDEVREVVRQRHEANCEGRDRSGPHERETRQYPVREVQGADVADEVLIVRAVRRNPCEPESWKCFIESAPKDKRADSDEETDRTEASTLIGAPFH
jgi:hypothetical protein